MININDLDVYTLLTWNEYKILYMMLDSFFAILTHKFRPKWDHPGFNQNRERKSTGLVENHTRWCWWFEAKNIFLKFQMQLFWNFNIFEPPDFTTIIILYYSRMGKTQKVRVANQLVILTLSIFLKQKT